MDLNDFGDFGEIDLTPLWIRRITWDALPCDMVEDVQRELGLVPYGDAQQSDQDHKASHVRVSLVEDLSSAVEFLAPFVSTVLTKAIIMQLSSGIRDVMSDDIEKKLVEQNSEIIRSASLTILMQFIATGVLEYTKLESET